MDKLSSDTYNVFLDSTTLKMNFRPFERSWTTLEWLATGELVKIVMSHVNRGEHISWIGQECGSIGEEFENSFKKVKRNFNVQDESMIGRIREAVEKIKRESEELFTRWLIRNRVDVLLNDTEDVDSVFIGYFSGKPPFRKVKERNDIPDAFMFSSIKKLDVQRTYVITADERLATSLSDEDFSRCAAYS
jgi:PIN domain